MRFNTLAKTEILRAKYIPRTEIEIFLTTLNTDTKLQEYFYNSTQSFGTF